MGCERDSGARNPAGFAEIVEPEATEPAVAVVDLRETADENLDAIVSGHVDDRNASLDLTEGPMVALTYFDLGPARPPRLLISSHWLVMDYYSSRVFYEDLRTAYFQLERGDEVSLPPKTASLPQCFEQLDHYVRSSEVTRQRPHWRAFADQYESLPVDHRTGPNLQSSADRYMTVVGGTTAATVLDRLPRERGFEVREILLTALLRTVTEWSGSDGVTVELEGHGRERAFGELDVSRTIGRFSTMSPARLSRSGELCVLDELAETRDQLRSVPFHGVGYGLLRYLHPDPEVAAELEPVSAPELGFNYWGDVTEYFTEDAHPVVDSFGFHRNDAGTRPRVLDLMALAADGTLRLVWTYSTKLHTQQTVQELSDRFVAVLTEMAELMEDGE